VAPAAKALGQVSQLASHTEELCQYADTIFATALTVTGLNPSEGAAKGSNGAAYEYLVRRRQLAVIIDDMDEWKYALAECREFMQAERQFEKTNEKRWKRACRVSWSLNSLQNDMLALLRQAEVLTATQDAIMRSYGIKLWQGRKRYMRWEGDRNKKAS
jgi:hypothetical protein